MKPKLKVGDYAEVINPKINAFGQSGFIFKINMGLPFPIYLKHKGMPVNVYKESELKKVLTPWSELPSLPDLEQYRLSLEVYADLIESFYSGCNPADYEDFDSWRNDFDWTKSTWQLLTEILEA